MFPKHLIIFSDTLTHKDVLCQIRVILCFAERTVQAKNADESIEGNKSLEENWSWEVRPKIC